MRVDASELHASCCGVVKDLMNSLLDGETKKIIATGKPEEIKNTTQNEFVKRFFNREPLRSYLNEEKG